MYKRRELNKSEDKERQDVPADYENDRYISFPPLKVSNCLVNLGKETRSLTYLISIKSKR